MRCEKCRSENVIVIDSRSSDGNTVRRRRRCWNCGERFTTVEIPAGEYSTLKGKERQLDTIANYMKGYTGHG